MKNVNDIIKETSTQLLIDIYDEAIAKKENDGVWVSNEKTRSLRELIVKDYVDSSMYSLDWIVNWSKEELLRRYHEKFGVATW